ncbi:MAG: hypothetical protein R3C60_13425 [Parvularculaceae bacterium]
MRAHGIAETECAHGFSRDPAGLLDARLADGMSALSRDGRRLASAA